MLLSIKSSSPTHIRGEASSKLNCQHSAPLRCHRYGVLVTEAAPVDRISGNVDIINDPLTRKDQKSLFTEVCVIIELRGVYDET